MRLLNNTTELNEQKNYLLRILRKAGRFLIRVLKGFKANQGILLAGAVAYNTLLSIIPIFILLLVALSHFVDRQKLITILNGNLELIVPQHSQILVDQIINFLDHRYLVGWIGVVILLFFSSLAFTILENAMSVIFFHRVQIRRRHFLVSAIIPYIYIMLIGIAILFITLISGALQAVEGEKITLLVWTIEFNGVTGTVLYFFGVIGLILLLTSFYMVMPVGKISTRHALIGGLTAGILWEVTRHILIWYFSTISMVNLFYGSWATVIIVLLSLEVAAVILLLGAQVIAEYERILEEREKRKAPQGLRTEQPETSVK